MSNIKLEHCETSREEVVDHITRLRQKLYEYQRKVANLSFTPADVGEIDGMCIDLITANHRLEQAATGIVDKE